jgi:prepilin-type N-terminal cleavage/methylation domain-containing protein
MRKVKGFTLIELLIVVAIIAILAAIAVPNFLEAQVRSKVSRVKADQRSLATAIEAYYVDNNEYPAAKTGDSAANGGVDSASAQDVYTFAVQNGSGTAANLLTLTTPIAYITSYPADPFADARISFCYYKDTNGWILGSFGPNTDQDDAGNLNWTVGGEVETVYDSTVAQPAETLLVGARTSPDGSYTYDPTNGTVSAGDVWRVKQ